MKSLLLDLDIHLNSIFSVPGRGRAPVRSQFSFASIFCKRNWAVESFVAVALSDPERLYLFSGMSAFFIALKTRNDWPS